MRMMGLVGAPIVLALRAMVPPRVVMAGPDGGPGRGIVGAGASVVEDFSLNLLARAAVLLLLLLLGMVVLLMGLMCLLVLVVVVVLVMVVMRIHMQILIAYAIHGRRETLEKIQRKKYIRIMAFLHVKNQKTKLGKLTKNVWSQLNPVLNSVLFVQTGYTLHVRIENSCHPIRGLALRPDRVVKAVN